MVNEIYNFVCVKNKVDKDFCYNIDLADDLLNVHNIELEAFIPRIYGTKFSIKFVHREPELLVFKLWTNDDRDPVFYFGEHTFPIFRLEIYGDYQGEDAIVELFRQTVIKVENVNTAGI